MGRKNIDFADPGKRQLIEIKPIRVKRITPPIGPKARRLKLIKSRAIVFERKRIKLLKDDLLSKENINSELNESQRDIQPELFKCTTSQSSLIR